MKHRFTYRFYTPVGYDKGEWKYRGRWIEISCSRCECLRRVGPLNLIWSESPHYSERFYFWSWIIESYQIMLAQVPTCEDAKSGKSIQSQVGSFPWYGKLTTGVR